MLLHYRNLIIVFRNQLNEDDRIGLQNEIDILMHVDHPNIVKLYEVYEDENTYSLVMELMTGGEVCYSQNLCRYNRIL